MPENTIPERDEAVEQKKDELKLLLQRKDLEAALPLRDWIVENARHTGEQLFFKALFEEALDNIDGAISHLIASMKAAPSIGILLKLKGLYQRHRSLEEYAEVMAQLLPLVELPSIHSNKWRHIKEAYEVASSQESKAVLQGALDYYHEAQLAITGKSEAASIEEKSAIRLTTDPQYLEWKDKAQQVLTQGSYRDQVNLFLAIVKELWDSPRLPDFVQMFSTSLKNDPEFRRVVWNIITHISGGKWTKKVAKDHFGIDITDSNTPVLSSTFLTEEKALELRSQWRCAENKFTTALQNTCRELEKIFPYECIVAFEQEELWILEHYSHSLRDERTFSVSEEHIQEVIQYAEQNNYIGVVLTSGRSLYLQRFKVLLGTMQSDANAVVYFMNLMQSVRIGQLTLPKAVASFQKKFSTKTNSNEPLYLLDALSSPDNTNVKGILRHYFSTRTNIHNTAKKFLREAAKKDILLAYDVFETILPSYSDPKVFALLDTIIKENSEHCMHDTYLKSLNTEKAIYYVKQYRHHILLSKILYEKACTYHDEAAIDWLLNNITNTHLPYNTWKPAKSLLKAYLLSPEKEVPEFSKEENITFTKYIEAVIRIARQLQDKLGYEFTEGFLQWLNTRYSTVVPLQQYLVSFYKQYNDTTKEYLTLQGLFVTILYKLKKLYKQLCMSPTDDSLLKLTSELQNVFEEVLHEIDTLNNTDPSLRTLAVPIEEVRAHQYKLVREAEYLVPVLVQRGAFEMLNTMYQLIRKNFPNNHVKTYFAYTLYRNKLLLKALYLFEELLLDEPDNVHFLTTYAACLLSKGHDDHALNVLHRAVALAPNDPIPKTLKAGILLEGGQTKEAECIIQELYSKHPTDAHVEELFARFKPENSLD